MDYGRISNVERNSEIYLPIGHYFISNSKDKLRSNQPKVSIYGLGSCIALILIDYKNKVSGISHILLPNARLKKPIDYPHKYADLSPKLLIQELLKHGAARKNIKAIIVGGSKIFDLDQNFMGIDNTTAIQKELEKLNIKIVGQEIGGNQGRAVIFDIKDLSVRVKLTGESKYRKVNQIM